MADKLKKIRDAHARRPIIGKSPGEIEAAQPEKIEIEEPAECIVEGCQKEQFRWQPRCKTHHLAWIKAREKENAESRKARERYLSTKKGRAEADMESVKQSVIYCQLCSSYMKFADKVAVERDSLPKTLALPRNKFLVICTACDADRA